MADEGVSVTLKAGRDYDAPWIVIHGQTTGHVSKHLNDLEEFDLLNRVKRLGQHFSKMTVDSGNAVENIQAVVPGSEVVASNDPSVKEQELPASLQGTPCKECGKTARLREGYSQKKGRHYAGYFCTADSNHRPTNFRWV